MWVPIVILAAATVGLSYAFSAWMFDSFLADQGFYCGDDGRWRCVREIVDALPVADFTYAMRDGICEAFQVGAAELPKWAVNEPNIAVIISEPQRVILQHSEDQTFSVQKGDWVVKMPNGHYGAISDNEFHDMFVKVNTKEAGSKT